MLVSKHSSFPRSIATVATIAIAVCLPLTFDYKAFGQSPALPSFEIDDASDTDVLNADDQPDVAMRIPARDESTARLAQTAWQADVLEFEGFNGFSRRPSAQRLPRRGESTAHSHGNSIQRTTWNEPVIEGPYGQPRRDEYIYDGNDRGKGVKVDRSWNMIGLDSEDTVGHFDTLDGRRLVSPSNRVAIYAPRFGSVRRVDRIYNATLNQQPSAYEDRQPIATSRAADFSTSSQQHTAVGRYEGSNRASSFRDRTRGVLADNTTELFGFNNSFSPYEHLSLMRLGRYEESESARLALGMQSADVWQEDLELQVVADWAQPVIVHDVAKVQQLVHIESDDENAILRVVKIASKIAARAGEKVQFTIRFDNLSGKRIGNVTIIDNLTTRLEYIVDSAECSLPAKLRTSRNEVGSQTLRWEITDPIPASEGGVIRFECRVR
jgi:uncharacterized repeat protein (TIGR01451 family)